MRKFCLPFFGYLMFSLLCFNSYGQQINTASTAGKIFIRQEGSFFYLWYSSKKGDTKDFLSKKYNIDVDTLTRYNATVQWGALPEKTLLRMPITKGNFSFTKNFTASDTTVALYHTVMANESLQQLSSRYFGVSIENIKKWNNFSSTDQLKTGSIMIVGYFRRKRMTPSSTATTVNTTTSSVAKNAKPSTTQKQPIVDVIIKDGKQATAPIEKKPVTPTVATKKIDPIKPVEAIVNKAPSSVTPPAPVVKDADKKDTVTKPATLPSVPVENQPAVSTPQEEKDAYILNKSLAKNRVNYVVRLSYVRSAFTGKDAVSGTKLIKNNEIFEASNIAGKNPVSGFSGGFGIENKFGKIFSLQTELLYEKKGGDINIEGVETIAEPVKGKLRVRLSYLSFAVLPRFSFGNKLVVYTYGGLYGGFLLKSSIQGEAGLENNGGTSSIIISNLDSRKFTKADLGYAAGLGFKFPYRKSRRQHFILEGRLSQSFNTVAQEPLSGNVPNFLNRAFYITAGYEFNR